VLSAPAHGEVNCLSSSLQELHARSWNSSAENAAGAEGNMLRLSRVSLSIIVIGVVFAISACTGGGGNEVEMYYDEISPFVDPATDATIELDEINKDLARLDISLLSRSELFQKAEIAATATANAHDKVTAAREGMHETIPPAQCAALHNVVFKSLQVSEQGLAELRLYYQWAFQGRDGSRALAEGNRLTAEADRIKSNALRVAEDCQ
jgi:hypothetical protein